MKRDLQMKISKSKISLYSKLSRKKYRQAEGLFLIEGTKCVLDTIDAFEIEAIVATEEWLNRHSCDFAPILERQPSLLIYEATNADMHRISSLSTPPDVIAVCKIPHHQPLSFPLKPRLYLMLDGIQDPGNLGTIMRVADWFGVYDIFASPDSVDLYNPKTIQATMGALKRVRVHYCPLDDMIAKNDHLPIFGTLLDGENIYTSTLSEHGFIVMGNEGNGISADLKKRITHRLLIPSHQDPNKDGCSESLNVAIATAITLSVFRNTPKTQNP